MLFAELSIDIEHITTTPQHPFWVPQKGWTAAVDLRAGDRLQLLNGEYVVIEQIQHELLESPVTVYNFEVEGFHTYYVTDSAILVHNKCETGQSQAPKNANGEDYNMYVQLDSNGNMKSYTIYNQQGLPTYRFDLDSHGGASPHIHLYEWDDRGRRILNKVFDIFGNEV